jgi:hypothetical protein
MLAVEAEVLDFIFQAVLELAELAVLAEAVMDQVLVLELLELPI